MSSAKASMKTVLSPVLMFSVESSIWPIIGSIAKLTRDYPREGLVQGSVPFFPRYRLSL